jgi:hypothetical protein
MQKKFKFNKKNNLKNLENKGYTIIYNLFNKSEVKELLKSYEENLNYCLSLIGKKDLNFSIDNKYLFLENHQQQR